MEPVIKRIVVTLAINSFSISSIPILTQIVHIRRSVTHGSLHFFFLFSYLKAFLLIRTGLRFMFHTLYRESINRTVIIFYRTNVLGNDFFEHENSVKCSKALMKGHATIDS